MSNVRINIRHSMMMDPTAVANLEVDIFYDVTQIELLSDEDVSKRDKRGIQKKDVLIPIGSCDQCDKYPIQLKYVDKARILPQFGRTTRREPIRDFLAYLKNEKTNFVKRYLHSPETLEAVPKDFVYIRELGRGAFARVNMVKKVDQSRYYAQKCMSKDILVSTKYKLNQAKNEKKILQAVRFAFLIHLKYFYQDNSELYYILPVVAGGELYHHLRHVRKFSEQVVKFVVAQLVLALQYLHFMGIIHRDLKLENVLLDHTGFIKLSDFGMCKMISESRTYTICGTPEYIAPEVIQAKGYGLAADWWSLGIIMYELYSGYTPFLADDIVQIFYLITRGTYDIPSHFSPSSSNLLSNLLEQDLTKRFGNLKNGVDDIKNHEWFRSQPWLDLLNRNVPSPIIPQVQNLDSPFFVKQPIPKRAAEGKNIYGKAFDGF